MKPSLINPQGKPKNGIDRNWREDPMSIDLLRMGQRKVAYIYIACG